MEGLGGAVCTAWTCILVLAALHAKALLLRPNGSERRTCEQAKKQRPGSEPGGSEPAKTSELEYKPVNLPALNEAQLPDLARPSVS